MSGGHMEIVGRAIPRTGAPVTSKLEGLAFIYCRGTHDLFARQPTGSQTPRHSCPAAGHSPIQLNYHSHECSFTGRQAC